uniref:AIG1-type G domain-containing protein n=1 Tax=Biomphalaria glabrata TaxID=6526 RepID=A0A2C9L358_BIOGL
MTYGDLYEQESCTDFLDWVSDQKSGVFREFLQECDNRIVLFNNKTSDKEKQEGQLMKLLNIVKTLKLQNCRYADEHYFTGKTNRDYLTVQAQKDFIEKEAMEGANFINETLKILLGSRGSDRDILLFNDMLNKANHLQKFIKDKDKGTGVLGSVSHYVSSIISSIENELQIYNRITEEKDKFKLKVKLEAAENSLKLQKIREEYEHKIKKDKRLEALKMEKLQDQIKRMEDLKQSWRREMNNLERKHSIERSASNQQYQLLAKQFDEIKSLYEKQSRKERKKNIFTKMFQKSK